MAMNDPTGGSAIPANKNGAGPDPRLLQLLRQRGKARMGGKKPPMAAGAGMGAGGAASAAGAAGGVPVSSAPKIGGSTGVGSMASPTGGAPGVSYGNDTANMPAAPGAVPVQFPNAVAPQLAGAATNAANVGATPPVGGGTAQATDPAMQSLWQTMMQRQAQPQSGQ